MRKIDKQGVIEPLSLKQFKRQNKQGNYSDLTPAIRQDIRQACTKEQFHLCAYCCKRISGNSRDTMNEHVEARNLAPNKDLDYTNIVASCTTPNQCDDAHGSQPLPLTPFDNECETDLAFKISGRVTGLTSDAQETIHVLNLNKQALVKQRQQLILAITLGEGINLEQDDPSNNSDIVEIMIEMLQQPSDGKLEAFSPAIINALKGWLDV